METGGESFWRRLARFAARSEIVIDRPRGSRHPRFPELVYPLDYGYMVDTACGDGNEIDVWVGSLPERALSGIVCTLDEAKRDAELKVVLGCTAGEIEAVVRFHNSGPMSAVFLEYDGPA